MPRIGRRIALIGLVAAALLQPGLQRPALAEPPPPVPLFWVETPKPMPTAAGLNRINWDSVETRQWSGAPMEGKQAEFLMETGFPWALVERLRPGGVLSVRRPSLPDPPRVGARACATGAASGIPARSSGSGWLMDSGLYAPMWYVHK